MINKNRLTKSSFRTDVKYIKKPEKMAKVDIPWYTSDQLDPTISLRWDICRFRWVGSTKPTGNLLNWDTFIDTSTWTEICIYNSWTRYCV